MAKESTMKRANLSLETIVIAVLVLVVLIVLVVIFANKGGDFNNQTTSCGGRGGTCYYLNQIDPNTPLLENGNCPIGTFYMNSTDCPIDTKCCMSVLG